MGCAPGKPAVAPVSSTQEEPAAASQEGRETAQNAADEVPSASQQEGQQNQQETEIESGQLVAPLIEDAQQEQNQQQDGNNNDMVIVCGIEGELGQSDETPKLWLEMTDEQATTLQVNVDLDVPSGLIDPLLHSLNSEATPRHEMKEADIKIGDVDGFDAVKRFKLLFLKDDHATLQARADILKEELAKIHADNEYRILRVISSINSEATEATIASLKGAKRSKSALQGFVGELPTPPLDETAVDGEAADATQHAENDGQNENEPVAELQAIESDQQAATDGPKSEQQDSAVESADGMISPHNSLISATEPGKEEESHCISASDEGILAQILQAQQQAESVEVITTAANEEAAMPAQLEQPAPDLVVTEATTVTPAAEQQSEPLPPPPTAEAAPAEPPPAEQQSAKVDENPKMTTSQTFVVQVDEEPKAPAPPADHHEAAKDDWDVENNQPEEDEDLDKLEEHQQTTIVVKVSKKSNPSSGKKAKNSQVEQIKLETHTTHRPASGKKGGGKQEALTTKNSGGSNRPDSPKSRPVSRTSSIASQPKKAHDQRPTAAKASRGKKH